jgi:chromosome partitioning protein
VAVQKIVILNPKGGSGKSTLATNLASYFAVHGRKPTLMDLDAQGSSMRWMSKRNAEQPFIYGVAGFERKMGMTRSFAMRTHADSEVLIVDTPGAVEPQRLPDLTRDAHTILVPVLPSDIDIHAATRCISDLLLVAKIKRSENRIGVIANRVRRNTIMYRSLMKFLYSLQIPVVATLRDSQVYVRAFDHGIGLFEMKPYMVREDLEQWSPLLGWINNRELPAQPEAQQGVLDFPLPAFPEPDASGAQPGFQIATSQRLTPYPQPRKPGENAKAISASEQIPPLFSQLSGLKP